VQQSVLAQGVGVVLDPHGGGLGGTQGVDPEQKRQGAVVDGDALGDLQEPISSSRSKPWVRDSSW
jgi:hypothetical protein